MKREIFAGLIIGILFTAAAFALPVTKIQYETTDLSSGRWQYTYEVTNISLTKPIVEFTIWFDYGLYDNLSIETPDPPAGNWNEVIVQPEPVLSDDGYYDALTLSLGIGIGEMESGFSVSFDWLGAGQPGSQLYEIIDPETFEALDSGSTIPEPATLLLFGFGIFTLMSKQKKIRNTKH